MGKIARLCQIDCHTWPQSHAGIDLMPDRMNLDFLKLLYCEFQKFEVMTMSVVTVAGQPKKHANPSYKVTKHQILSSNVGLLLVVILNFIVGHPDA